MKLPQMVAENLRALRLSKGLAQEALAQRARLSVSYVSMLERGLRTPPLDTLESLAKALDVPPTRLLESGAARGRRR